MKKRLYTIALVSSPIFAMYAISHPIIFGLGSFRLFLLPLIGLTLNIFIIWSLNIYTVLRFPGASFIQRIGWSYLFNALFQLIFVGLSIFVLPRPDELAELRTQFYLHPVITSVVINFVIALICNFMENSHLRAEAEVKARDLHLEKSEAEKKLMTQQFQPHFLFNALSVLKSLISENPEQAEIYTLRLSEFLRYAIQWSKAETVSLKDELEFTQNYIELQRLRFGDSFSYEVDLEEEFLQRSVPVFSLQPLVENAFKHNQFTLRNPLVIKVKARENQLEICNNKSKKMAQTSNKTGLENLNRRFELGFGKGIEIRELENEFCVILPLKKV